MNLILVALASVTLALAGTSNAWAQEQEPPPDGKPDIHGTWKGRAQALESHLGGTTKNGHVESYPIELDSPRRRPR